MSVRELLSVMGFWDCEIVFMRGFVCVLMRFVDVCVSCECREV